MSLPPVKYRIERCSRCWDVVAVWPLLHWPASPDMSSFELERRDFIHGHGVINNTYIAWYNNKTGALLVDYPACYRILGQVVTLALELSGMDFPT